MGGVKEEEGERERGELVQCDPRKSMRWGPLYCSVA